MLLIAGLLVFLGMCGWMVLGLVWGNSLTQNQILGWKPVTPIGRALRWGILRLKTAVYGLLWALTLIVFMILAGGAINWLGPVVGGILALVWDVVMVLELLRLRKVIKSVPK